MSDSSLPSSDDAASANDDGHQIAGNLITRYSDDLKDGYECETIGELLKYLNSRAKADGFAIINNGKGLPRANSAKNLKLGIAGERVNPRFICQEGNHNGQSKPKLYAEGQAPVRRRGSRLKTQATACKYRIAFTLRLVERDGAKVRTWVPSYEHYVHNHPSRSAKDTARMTVHRRQWILENEQMIVALHREGVKRRHIMTEIQRVHEGEPLPVLPRDITNLLLEYKDNETPRQRQLDEDKGS